MPRLTFRPFVQATALATALAMVPVTTAALAQVDSDSYRELDRFMDVFNIVKAQYVDNVDNKVLVKGAIQGMLAALDPQQRFEMAVEEARKQGAVPEAAPEEYIKRIVQVGEANVRALQSYAPAALNGTARGFLFLPHIKGELSTVAGQEVNEDGDLGWGAEVGQELEIHEVPGDHFSMMFG